MPREQREPRPVREIEDSQAAMPYAPATPMPTPAPEVRPAPPAPAEASPEPAAPRAPEAAGSEPSRAHRPKADPNWMPRLIAPVEGASTPAAAPVVTAAPKPKKPADDFVPRLISPAPKSDHEGDNGDHTP